MLRPGEDPLWTRSSSQSPSLAAPCSQVTSATSRRSPRMRGTSSSGGRDLALSRRCPPGPAVLLHRIRSLTLSVPHTQNAGGLVAPFTQRGDGETACGRGTGLKARSPAVSYPRDWSGPQPVLGAGRRRVVSATCESVAHSLLDASNAKPLMVHGHAMSWHPCCGPREQARQLSALRFDGLPRATGAGGGHRHFDELIRSHETTSRGKLVETTRRRSVRSD